MPRIGTLARKTGTKVQTIRYYEQIGPIPEPSRSEGRRHRPAPVETSRTALRPVRGAVRSERCTGPFSGRVAASRR